MRHHASVWSQVAPNRPIACASMNSVHSNSQPQVDLSGLALQPRRLVQVLWASTLAVVVGLLISVSRQQWVVATLLALAVTLLALAMGLVRRGQLTRAAGLMLFTITMAVCGLVFFSQGIHDEAISAFPGILVFASMFGTRRLYLGLLAVIFAGLGGIVGIGLLGWHSNVIQPAGWGALVNTLAILSVTAYFVWLMAGDLRGALARLESDKLRLLESNAHIEILAHRDALTNLPNRVLALDRLEQAIANARRNQDSVAVLFLDLDNFKTVNDSLGHGAGDLLLRDVAQRLLQTVRDTDTVSRQGGDEFLIILGGLADESAATAIASKINEQLARPFQLNGLEVAASGSVGVALFPKDGLDPDTLLKNADLAMYRAKDSGRNAFRFFDPEMNSSVVEHLHLSSGIRTALANREFAVYYQPQMELATGRVIGAEALIRWKHPSLGFIPPARFIPVAERAGLINEIGAWVLNEACCQSKVWQRAGLQGLVVAVNVSPVQFRRDDIEREVANALLTWDLAPSCIELELTESLLMADSEHLSGVLARLRGSGIAFSIDDFGTGYSNLGYLKRFDVQRLKIDQSFIRKMTDGLHHEGIVRAIIEMAHCLDLEVVAEGVEDAATLKRLVELGCEFGQGFHWAAALPASEFLDFVRSHQPSPQVA